MRATLTAACESLRGGHRCRSGMHAPRHERARPQRRRARAGHADRLRWAEGRSFARCGETCLRWIVGSQRSVNLLDREDKEDRPCGTPSRPIRSICRTTSLARSAGTPCTPFSRAATPATALERSCRGPTGRVSSNSLPSPAGGRPREGTQLPLIDRRAVPGQHVRAPRGWTVRGVCGGPPDRSKRTSSIGGEKARELVRFDRIVGRPERCRPAARGHRVRPWCDGCARSARRRGRSSSPCRTDERVRSAAWDRRTLTRGPPGRRRRGVTTDMTDSGCDTSPWRGHGHARRIERTRMRSSLMYG